jgi:hypothetical protein
VSVGNRPATGAATDLEGGVIRLDLDRWTPFDPDRAVAAAGLDVSYWRFHGLLGLFVAYGDGTGEIGLDETLAAPENDALWRQVIAHELGHLALHRGVHLGVVDCRMDAVLSSRVELQAERFGADLIAPLPLIAAFVARAERVDATGTAELAELCGTTPRWMVWRLGDLARRGLLRDLDRPHENHLWVPSDPYAARFTRDYWRRCSRANDRLGGEAPQTALRAVRVDDVVRAAHAQREHGAT